MGLLCLRDVFRLPLNFTRKIINGFCIVCFRLLFVATKKVGQNDYCDSFALNFWLYDDYYASPSSGEAYSDRQLTLNFELWVEIFCELNVSIWGFENSVCLSVPREKKSMERFSRVLQHGNPPKIDFIFKKGRNKILTCAELLESL